MPVIVCDHVLGTSGIVANVVDQTSAALIDDWRGGLALREDLMAARSRPCHGRVAKDTGINGSPNIGNRHALTVLGWHRADIDAADFAVTQGFAGAATNSPGERLTATRGLRNTPERSGRWPRAAWRW